MHEAARDHLWTNNEVRLENNLQEKKFTEAAFLLLLILS